MASPLSGLDVLLSFVSSCRPCNETTMFKCANGQCVAKHLRCDFDPDCSDNSDEMNCPPRNCSDIADIWYPTAYTSPLIQCNHTTACIHPKWICDKQNDCWDNSDEENCDDVTVPPQKECPDTKFKCDNGQCVSLLWRCDKDNDCEDSSDEKNCTYNCRKDQFKCLQGDCIPLTWQCDLTPDCSDGSDETSHCQTRECPPSNFRCNTTGRCIPLAWVCDSEGDCADNSDEHPDQGCLNHHVQKCDTNMFQCLNNRCISKEYYCDGDDDCGDNSDEQHSCQPHCPPSEFMCSTGLCISRDLLCNGVNDCLQNSDEDEQNCSGKYKNQMFSVDTL